MEKASDAFSRFISGLAISILSGYMLWRGIKYDDFLIFIFGAIYLPVSGAFWSDLINKGR